MKEWFASKGGLRVRIVIRDIVKKNKEAYMDVTVIAADDDCVIVKDESGSGAREGIFPYSTILYAIAL